MRRAHPRTRSAARCEAPHARPLAGRRADTCSRAARARPPAPWHDPDTRLPAQLPRSWELARRAQPRCVGPSPGLGRRRAQPIPGDVGPRARRRVRPGPGPAPPRLALTRRRRRKPCALPVRGLSQRVPHCRRVLSLCWPFTEAVTTGAHRGAGCFPCPCSRPVQYRKTPFPSSLALSSPPGCLLSPPWRRQSLQL